MKLERMIDTLRQARFRVTCEDDLQRGIADLLTGEDFEREVRLGPFRAMVPWERALWDRRQITAANGRWECERSGEVYAVMEVEA